MIAEYYNKETLLDFVNKYTPNFGGTTSLQCVERAIENAPTVDVVEVVRCKDCKHFKSNERASERFGCGRCIRNSSFEPLELSTVMECDFCSLGERRSDDE